MTRFLSGFLSELEKLGAEGTFVAEPPKKAPSVASSKTELEKRQAGGVNKALSSLGAAVNKPYKEKRSRLDFRPPKAPT